MKKRAIRNQENSQLKHEEASTDPALTISDLKPIHFAEIPEDLS